jgi:putative colanic acid biosynthesis UDP-glucose lipid carrier transferase
MDISPTQIERPKPLNPLLVDLNPGRIRIVVKGAGEVLVPKPGSNFIIKRGFDIIFSSAFIVLVLSWLIPLLAVLIKVNSKGPVFFLQKRTGLNGRVFTCIKLRTMRVNNSADLKQAAHNDERITPLGHFLRNTNLDELPQFINVLMGDMSVIGPRPHMVYHTKQFENKFEGYDRRLFVKPGLTGLAQIKGWRGPTPTQRSIYKRIQWDIYYVLHQNASLDSYIFFKTIVEVFANFYNQIFRT